MKTSYAYIAVILALVFLPAQKAFSTPYDEVRKETITLVGEKHCPYNCEPSVKKDLIPDQMEYVDSFRRSQIDGNGYIIDIANAIYQPLGYNVKYIIMPQKEAKGFTSVGRHTILLSQTKRSKKYLFSEKSIGINAPSFYTSSGIGWKYAGVNSLEMVTLGLIAEREYPAIADYIKANKSLKLRIQEEAGKNALESNIRKLAKNRISAILDNKYEIDYYRRIMNLDDTIVYAGSPAKPKKLYMAFAAKTPNAKKHRDEFDKGIVQLRKSGQLREILNKYGIEDWE